MDDSVKTVEVTERQSKIIAWALRRSTGDPHFVNVPFKAEVTDLATRFDNVSFEGEMRSPEGP